jgi:hypothetical protein
MAGLMNGAVRLVTVHFSFSNLDLVPTCLKQKKTSPSEFVTRKEEVRGEQFLEPIEKVDCSSLPPDLASIGFVLADAFTEIREKKGRQYAVVQFIFSDIKYANCSEEFLANRPLIEEALRLLLEQGMWRVRAFLNHLFKDREIIEEKYAISINLDARMPLVDKNGDPLIRWQKDESGNRIGDAPVPVKPKLFLEIGNEEIYVMS